jgi:hypothetical protein
MLAQTALDCRPKRHSSRVTLFGAEEGGAGSGHAQAYQDRAVRPSHSRCQTQLKNALTGYSR